MWTSQFEYPGVRQYIRKAQNDFGWDWVGYLLQLGGSLAD